MNRPTPPGHPGRLQVAWLMTAALAFAAWTPAPTLAESDSDPRELEIHDLEGHWYLLRLSVDAFKTETQTPPATDYDRRELYQKGLDLRSLCQEQLDGTRQLLRRKPPLEEEFWYRSRLQVLKNSLLRAVSEIEDTLQQLQPGPIVP